MLYLGADHGGFKLKEQLKGFLEEQGIEYEDLGNKEYDEQDDYPVFAKAVAEKVAKMPAEHKGIVFCRSGVGVNIVADKHYGVKSALALNKDQIKSSREDDDINVLAIASDYTTFDELEDSVKTFLETKFSGAERHRRRLGIIEDIEDENMKPVRACSCENCQCK